MERIKNYLVELTKTDNAIAAVWDEAKLKDCWDYIRKQAQKLAKNGCAMVEDAQVYKWARDFYLGDIETESATEVREEKPVVKETLTTEEKNYTEVKAKTENGVEYTQIVQNDATTEIQEEQSDDGIVSYPIFDGEEKPSEVEEEIIEETPKTEKLHITAIEQEETKKEKSFTTMADIEAMKKPKTKKSKEEKEAEQKMIDAMQPSLFDDLF